MPHQETVPAEEGRGEGLQDKRYRAYERVFAALSRSAVTEEPGSEMTSADMSYRQHAVIETLRDLELSRRRFLLLHQDDAGDGREDER